MVSPAITIPGSLSRPLGNLEIFFKTLADAGKPLHREHWNIHVALQLHFTSSFIDPVPFLQQSWGMLRLQHPSLGSIIHSGSENDSNDSRLTIFEANVYDWIKDTFTVCESCDNSSQLFSALYSTPTATCYWIPSSSEFVIRSSHWRIDGVGITLLCHDFMNGLASLLQHSLEELRVEPVASLKKPDVIPPSLEFLAQAQTRLAVKADGEENSLSAAGADALVDEFLRGVPSIGLPTKADSLELVPGASACALTHLNAEVTTRLQESCRRSNIKVISAVHAAIVRVTAGFTQSPLCKSYSAFVPVDLRKALNATVPEEYKSVSKVVGLYFAGLPVRVNEVISGDGKYIKDFDSISRDLDVTYSRDLLSFWEPHEGHGQTLGLLDLVQSYVQRTTQLFSAPVPKGLPPVQTPDLSSLGKLEEYLQTEYGNNQSGKFELADFWIGTEMLNRSVQFHTWSWKGEFKLGACFNKSFYDEDIIVDILEKVLHELSIGCGLK